MIGTHTSFTALSNCLPTNQMVKLELLRIDQHVPWQCLPSSLKILIIKSCLYEVIELEYHSAIKGLSNAKSLKLLKFHGIRVDKPQNLSSTLPKHCLLDIKEHKEKADDVRPIFDLYNKLT